MEEIFKHYCKGDSYAKAKMGIIFGKLHELCKRENNVKMSKKNIIIKINLMDEIKKAHERGERICWDCAVYQQALILKPQNFSEDIARCGNQLDLASYNSKQVHALTEVDGCEEFVPAGESILRNKYEEYDNLMCV